MNKPVLKIRRNSRVKTLSLGALALGVSTALSTTTAIAQQAPANTSDAPLADYLKRLSEAQVIPENIPQQPQRIYQTATERETNNRFDAVRQSTFAVPEEQLTQPRYGLRPNVQMPTANLEPLADIANASSTPDIVQNEIDPFAPPNTDPTQTGRIQQGATNNQNPNRLLRVLRSRRAEPAQAFEARTLTRDPSPYAATGLKMGIWTIRPSVTTGAEITTNDDTSVTTSTTSFDLDAEANMADGTLSFDSQLNLSKAIDADQDIEITGNAALSGSRDLNNTVQALGGLNFQRSRVSATGDLTTLNTTSTDTDLNAFSVNFGLQNQNAKTQFSSNVEISREIYDDLMASGTTHDQSDRNNTSITGTLRLGYETSPVITPFVQVAATRRIMDNEYDANGLEQSGYTFDTSVGATFNHGEKFNGEASIGWLRTTFDDDQLLATDAVSLNALLNWSPRRNTNLALDLATTSNSGAGTQTGTSVSYVSGVTATQQLRDNFALTGRVGYTYRANKSEPNNRQIDLLGSAEYQFNRTFGVTGNVEHQITQTDGAETQNATTFRLGLTARR